MKVSIALLHEGDLLTFLRDLRDSGNAYYSVSVDHRAYRHGADRADDCVETRAADCDH